MRWGFETTLESIENQINTYITYVEDEEDLKISRDININNLKQFMKNYILWLCKSLSQSKEGTITIKEIRSKLQELYLQYYK